MKEKNSELSETTLLCRESKQGKTVSLSMAAGQLTRGSLYSSCCLLEPGLITRQLLAQVMLARHYLTAGASICCGHVGFLDCGPQPIYRNGHVLHRIACLPELSHITFSHPFAYNMISFRIYSCLFAPLPLP